MPVRLWGWYLGNHGKWATEACSEGEIQPAYLSQITIEFPGPANYPPAPKFCFASMERRPGGDCRSASQFQLLPKACRLMRLLASGAVGQAPDLLLHLGLPPGTGTKSAWPGCLSQLEPSMTKCIFTTATYSVIELETLTPASFPGQCPAPPKLTPCLPE